MKLLPAWQAHIGRTPSEPKRERAAPIVPKQPTYYSEAVRRLDTPQAAAAYVEFACQRPLAVVGLGFAFGYDSPGVPVTDEHFAWDPRSIVPSRLALAAVEPGAGDTLAEYAALVDPRDPAIAAALRPLFVLPVCFAGHDLKASLFCLWKLGLQEPTTLWDTWVHERVRYLGEFHRRYFADPGDPDPLAEIAAGDAMEIAREARLSLAATCQRYQVEFRYLSNDDRLRGSPSGASGWADQRTADDYALASARAAVRLYPAQVAQATVQGTLQHLVVIEMPWVVPNARMVWTGVRVDPRRRAAVIGQVDRLARRLTAALQVVGLADPGSEIALEACLRRLGLLEHFKVNGGYAFDKESLARAAHLHPIGGLLHHWRRARDIRSHKLLLSELVGADGRVHPELRQLGAETGRQSSRWPNILGVSRWLRPLVVPEPGYGIGEVDWAQIELGVAGALFGDEALVAMFNSGDVYAAMAQMFFAKELTEADRACTSVEFKRRHPERRDLMKVCTLGVLYGLGAPRLALQLRVDLPRAEAWLTRFRALFPVLCVAMDKAVALGAIRGYATTVTGLRRHRATPGACSGWERNWLGNHPIQGSAADVFKLAGIRLNRLYQRLGAMLLVPLHDAYIFEAPLDRLEEVAALTAQVMAHALQEVFPVLEPRVSVNIDHPGCWNKDGLTDPMRVWQTEVEEALRAAEHGPTAPGGET